MLVFHPSKYFAEFIFGEENFEFDAFLTAVATGDFIECTSAVEGADDVLANAFIVFGDDAEPFVVVEGGGEVVDDKSVNPGADETDDDHSELVVGDEEGGAADDGACDGDGGTNIEMEEFVDYFGEDIEATRGGVDAEHEGLGGTEKEYEAAEVEPWVTHDGSGACDGVVVGEDVFSSGVAGVPWHEPGPEVGKRTEDEGCVDCLGSKFFVDE